MVLVELTGGPADGLSTATAATAVGESLGFNVAGWPLGDYVLTAFASVHDRGAMATATWIPGAELSEPVPDGPRRGRAEGRPESTSICG